MLDESKKTEETEKSEVLKSGIQSGKGQKLASGLNCKNKTVKPLMPVWWVVPRLAQGFYADSFNSPAASFSRMFMSIRATSKVSIVRTLR
jgi:hypothetical protein